MLTSDELALLCERLHLSSEAQAVLQHIRSSPPARRVGSGGQNVPVRYQSRKMGQTIQAESRTVEFAGVYLMEHDPTVYEFWDQPPTLPLQYPVKLKNGKTRHIKVHHTPDYFVIRHDALGWEEWKTEDALRRFEQQESQRYVRDEQGKWRCPPGEALAAPLGFYYHVRSSAEIDEVFQRNLRFLSYYLQEKSLVVSEEARQEILHGVQHDPGITPHLLLSQMHVATSDELYALLAQEALYVDLSATPLAEPKRLHLFLNEATARAWALTQAASCASLSNPPHAILLQAGELLVWDGRPWRILNTGETTITLLAEDGTLIELSHAQMDALVSQGKLTGAVERPESAIQMVRERITGATKAALEEANRRYHLIQPILEGRASTGNTSQGRSLRRWLARYRAATQEYGSGYVGLLPNTHQRGNRQPRLSEQVRDLLTQVIAQEYEHVKQKNKREVYGEFVNACQAQGILSVPSYKTFVAAIKQRPRYEQVKKRTGARAAYAHEPLYWELTWTLPRHGDRPFEVVHIDHTELDVQLVDSRTGQPSGRPWATLMVDAFSRRVLAVYLTFDPPSYRSCMMVIRECVHRHHRLPELVVVDWGAEFESVYFETLLARYEVNKATRPKAKPRFGSVCERLFNTANTTFVHHLAGNTQIMKHVRRVSASVDPQAHAIWTLAALYAALRCFAYEVYDTCPHQTLGQTPREAFEKGLFRSGLRPRRLIPYDEEFLLLTLPTTRKGTAKLLPVRGIKINHLFYWAKGNAFLDHPELEMTQLPVRYDPFDMGHAYVLIDGKPVECISEYYTIFQGRSEREIRLASEELRRRNAQHAHRFTPTASKLAQFITSLEAREVLFHQQRHAEEAKAVLALMEGCTPTDHEQAGPERAAQEQTPHNGSEPATVGGEPSADREREVALDDIYEDFA